MNRLCDVTTFANDNAIVTMDRRHFHIAVAIHVLSIGPVDRGSMVHDALLHGPNFHLSIATDYRELWRMSMQESIQVAILHNTLSRFETEAVCRLIRRRWLHARILVVSAVESNLEDALYDDRVAPSVSSDVLFTTIERLAGGVHA
jgi:hypothetical protein